MRPQMSMMWSVQMGDATITAPIGPNSRHVVGDRLVPSPIRVDFPGGDDAPAFGMVIEVLDAVPRCTELVLRRHPDGGREIRQKDLREIELDYWVEVFVARISMEIVSEGEGGQRHSVPPDQESFRKGMRAIQAARKGSRRPMTDDLKRRVAEVYNAQEMFGLEAIEHHFRVSRSTAARYKRAALEAGLIEERSK